MDLSAILDVARAAALDAVAVQRRYLGQVAVEDWSEKGIADFVTHVDREAEAAIVARIERTFPGHAVLAEEAATADRGTGEAAARQSGGGAGDADWLWVIDPLDGTTNYLHRYPVYAVSIGVMQHEEPMVAVVRHGVTDQEWLAVRGGGAWLDGERIHVSGIDRLSHALIGTGFPFKALDLLPDFTAQFAAVLRGSAGVRRAGAAALDLCHVASGWFDGFWELSLAPWDVAAGTLMVREAGGIVTRLNGDPSVIGAGSLLAGNPAIHAALRDTLHAATPAWVAARAG